MSSKGKNPYADTEFVRAYHIERRECEAAYDVQVVTTITTACRPDRVVIRMEANSLLVNDRHDKPLCSTTTVWPNEQVMSFAAALFRTSVSLTRLVEDSRADLWKATLDAQRG